MYSLLVVLMVLGQSEIGVPPAPAADTSVVSATNAEEMRTWLLARLVIDSAFDEKKSAEAQRLLATMNAQQLSALVAAYQERSSRTEKASVPTTSSADPTQQAALDQAKLNLQQAQAYRDHLKREYDRRLLQGQMTQNLVYQNILNNQMFMYRSYGPFTSGAFGAGPFGVGGLGYGVLSYGAFGYGAPVYGGSFYGNPVW